MIQDEFQKQWEEWYGDVLEWHHWGEFEYLGKKVFYVCGRFQMSDTEGTYTTTFVQVIGYSDSEGQFNEGERKEIRKMLCRQQGVDNISFWGDTSAY